MTARRLLVLLSCAVALAGCRQLVEPDAVDRIGASRTIHGTVGSFDGFTTETAWFTLRPVLDDGRFGQPITAGPVELDGSFQAVVPRGTAGRGSVEVEWLVEDAPRAYLFGPVPLAGTSIVLDYAPRRITGRVVWPEGFVLAPDETALIEFEDAVAFPPSAVFYNDSFVAVGPEGAFDLVLPDRDWRIDLRLREAAGLDELDIDFGFPEIGDSLALEVPIVPLRVRIEAPNGLAPDTRVRIGALGRPETAGPVDTRVGTTWSGVVEDGEVDTWRPIGVQVSALRVFVEGSDRPVLLLDDRLRPALDEVPAGGTVTADLGEHLVRVFVRRDGSPVDGARVEVPWFGSLRWVRTGSEGIADCLVPFSAPFLVTVIDGDQRVDREFDVTGYTEIGIDLPPLPPDGD